MIKIYSKVNKNSFLLAIIQRYSSALFVNLSAFIVGMVVSKMLGPEMLGYWGIFHIITAYYSYSNLGATNGLTRDLGVAIGKNDKVTINKVIGSAHAIHLVLPGFVTFCLIIYGAFLPAPHSWLFICAGITGFILLYEETISRIINSFERHKTLSHINIWRSSLSLILVIPFVYFGGLNGRIFVTIVLGFIMFFITYSKLPLRLNILFDKQSIYDLIKVGFPIAMAGFLTANFYLVDRLVITKFLTIEALGYYVFAFYLVTVIKNIKQTISGILYQRQNIIFGEDGPDQKTRLLHVSKSAAYFTTDLTGVVSGLLLIVFSFAVKIYMPEYEIAIPLTYIIVFSQVMGSINVLNTIGRHFQFLVLILVALIFNVFLSVLFVKLFGLTGVAYATFISFLFYNIIINYYNLKYFGVSFKKSSLIVFRIISVSIYCFLVSWGLEYFLFPKISDSLFKDSIHMILLLIGYSIFMIPLIFLIKGHIKALNKIKLLVN